MKNTVFMYIQPGHGLNDFQEFQIRGKSKGGLISRFIFKGIWYWRLKIQVKFKGGLNVHKYVKFLSETFGNSVIEKIVDLS